MHNRIFCLTGEIFTCSRAGLGFLVSGHRFSIIRVTDEILTCQLSGQWTMRKRHVTFESFTCTRVHVPGAYAIRLFVWQVPVMFNEHEKVQNKFRFCIFDIAKYNAMCNEDAYFVLVIPLHA